MQDPKNKQSVTDKTKQKNIEIIDEKPIERFRMTCPFTDTKDLTFLAELAEDCSRYDGKK